MNKNEALEFLEALESGAEKIIDKNNNYALNVENKSKIVDVFKAFQTNEFECGPFVWKDKIPLRTSIANVRFVPGSVVRRGSYFENGVIVMPAFINIGAHVGENSMVDSFATIGSCAYIGKRCHISSSSVIAGVLEPVSEKPAIIEDDVFVGAQCLVSEGVHVKYGAVLAAGVHLTSSTKIIDRETGIEYDHVPACSLVVPGSYRSTLNENAFINCAWIVKKIDLVDRHSTSINKALRDLN